MDRLVDAVALALAIRKTTQTGTGQQANAARNDTRLITDDVAKQVAGHDNAVKGPGALDHQHSGRVNQLVLQLQLRELVLEEIGDRLPPQTARSQHVGLVETPDLGRRVLSEGQEGRQTGDALDLGAAVGLRVHGEALDAVVLDTVTKVDAARQLTHDDKVGATADLGLEGRAVDQRLGGEAAGPQVAVGLELLAQLEDAGLGADGGRGAPLWPADGAEEDGVGRLGGREGLVGQGRAGRVDGGLQEVLLCSSICRVTLGGLKGEVKCRSQGGLTPPKRCSCRLNLPADGLKDSIALMTCDLHVSDGP